MPNPNDDFKFPDESGTSEVQVQGENPEVEVEIVDDTPPQDRNRRPLGREVEDPTDEEIEKYSDKVQARIKELTHARHDERRRADTLAREREELERLSRQLLEENNTLKKSVSAGQEAYVTQTKEKAEAELAMARKRLKDAHDAFDTDAIVEAQEELAAAKMRFEIAKNFRPAPVQESTFPVQQSQVQAPSVQPDERTLRWQAKNQWFGQSGFEEYTSYALGLHQKLVSGGADPRSDEYFDQIDGRMKSKFPELFRNDDSPEPNAAQKKPTTVVAPAGRSTSAGKIRLTQTQMALAKKFGLTPQQYAVQVAKLENRNG